MTTDAAYVRRSAQRCGVRPGMRNHDVELRRWCVRANRDAPWLEWIGDVSAAVGATS